MRPRPGPRALWFVRHGQSEGNVLREAAEAEQLEAVELPTRDSDIPLSELGRRQAAALGGAVAELPPEERPTAVLVSPYLRTVQTAQALADLTGDWAGERVLFVTHDVPIQLARGLLEGADEASIVRLVTTTTYLNCALSTFEADGDGYRTERWNEIVAEVPAVTAEQSKDETAGPVGEVAG